MGALNRHGWVVCAALLAASAGVQAADGEALFTSKACAVCHGAQGKAPIMPTYPKLAGQNGEYLVNQTKDIRDGKRSSGQAAVMRAAVAAVTDEEIAAIAGYLAAVE